MTSAEIFPSMLSVLNWLSNNVFQVALYQQKCLNNMLFLYTKQTYWTLT